MGLDQVFRYLNSASLLLEQLSPNTVKTEGGPAPGTSPDMNLVPPRQLLLRIACQNAVLQTMCL